MFPLSILKNCHNIMDTQYLYGRDDVLREVETLEAAEAGEGVPAHRLDGVGLQGQRGQVLQALRAKEINIEIRDKNGFFRFSVQNCI